MKTWSLSSKIYLVVTVLVLSNVLSVVVGLHKIGALNEVMDFINNTIYKRIEIINKVHAGQLMLSIQARDSMLATPEERKKIESNMTDVKANVDKNLETYFVIGSEEGKVAAHKFQEGLTNWYKISMDISQLVSDQKMDEANDLRRTKLATTRDEIAKLLGSIVSRNEDQMTQAAEDAAQEYSRSRLQIILLSCISTLISLVLTFFIVRRFSRTIQTIVGNLMENSSQVASAAGQIASSSQELSQASTEQAASLEETASALEEISTMIAKSAESANTTELSSNESQQRAEDGRRAVGQMMASMDEISQSNEAIMGQVNKSNQEMSEIVRVIQEIGNKTKVINEIVFQTKLLSFNASVEAARAGEHGKGFAVVAEEVGNLAQMSGNAAKEITEMLDTSIVKVDQIVKDTKSKVESLVDQGKRKVEAGVNLARQSADVLDEIVRNVTKVTGLSQEISLASKEQAEGVGEINKAMTQLDAVTQQNASVSDEAASAAEELSAQAESLKAVVEHLVVAVKGGIATAQSDIETTKPQANLTSRAPIVPLKATPRKSPATATGPSFKVAAGDSMRPGRDDDGFN